MMRKKRGISLLLLLAAIFVTAGICVGQTQESGSTFTSRKVRRDLGDKGKIVIQSLDLNQVDLADVVRLLAKIAGINIITGDIQGSITVYLENVKVEDALDAILSSQGYGFIYDGNIVRIVDAARLGEDKVETITETFMLNYLPAEKVAKSLKNVFRESQGGYSFSQIEANLESNTIIAVDTPKRMEDIRRLIAQLDRRNDQVEIEGRFVEISYSGSQNWGIDWQFFQDPANALDVNLAPGALNAPNIASQFKFAVIRGDTNLNGFIQALQKDNDIRVLANPKILALENEKATIELTDELPFVEANISQGVITESIQFQEAGIRLIVTPQIAEEAQGTFIRMLMELEQRIAGERVTLQNSTAFPINSRRAQTSLIVPDDSTVIIGGLRSSDIQYVYDKVPFIGNVPILGLPFRKRQKSDRQTELLLFCTPRVIYDHPPLDCEEQELHDRVDKTADALRTQSKWREKAEAPVEALEKGVLYSGVNMNPDIYDQILDQKEDLECVKPYKVVKPKGERRFVIRGVGEQLTEQVIEAPVEEATGESEVAPAGVPVKETTGEVRDFSAIEKAVKPATTSSTVGWFGKDKKAEEGTGPATPTQPFIIQMPTPAPTVAPAPNSKQQEDSRPSWLRRGTRPRGDSNQEEPSSEEPSSSLEMKTDIQQSSADSQPVQPEEAIVGTTESTSNDSRLGSQTDHKPVVQATPREDVSLAPLPKAPLVADANKTTTTKNIAPDLKEDSGLVLNTPLMNDPWEISSQTWPKGLSDSSLASIPVPQIQPQSQPQPVTSAPAPEIIRLDNSQPAQPVVTEKNDISVPRHLPRAVPMATAPEVVDLNSVIAESEQQKIQSNVGVTRSKTDPWGLEFPNLEGDEPEAPSENLQISMKEDEYPLTTSLPQPPTETKNISPQGLRGTASMPSSSAQSSWWKRIWNK